MKRALWLMVCGSVTLSTAALADTYLLEMNPILSFLNVDFDSAFTLTGTVVGAYDEDTNPDGTITVDDGGIINVPVACDITVNAGGGGPASLPSVAHLEWTPGEDSAVLTDLAVTITSFGFSSSAVATFGAFATLNPSCQFPEGFSIAVGGPTAYSAGSILAVQTEPGVLGVAPSGPNSAIINGAVSLKVIIDGYFLSTPHEVSATFLGFVFGTLTFDDVGALIAYDLSLSGGIALEPGTIVDPLSAVPVSFPVGGPPGTVVNLLFNGAQSNAESESTLIGALIGQAVPCLTGDLDCNGIVDGIDLGILLGQWGNAGNADFDGNGTVDAADLGILLGYWNSED